MVFVQYHGIFPLVLFEEASYKSRLNNALELFFRSNGVFFTLTKA
jgi:hypothetical protein